MAVAGVPMGRQYDRAGRGHPLQERELQAGGFPKDARRQGGPRPSQEGADTADDAAPGDGHEEQPGITAFAAIQAKTGNDLGHHREHHRGDGMLAHAAGKRNTEQENGQSQSLGSPAETGQHRPGQPCRQAAAGHGRRKNKCAENEEHRFVAKLGIGAFGIHDAEEWQHHHGEQGGDGNRQQSRDPEKDGGSEEHDGVIPVAA